MLRFMFDEHTAKFTSICEDNSTISKSLVVRFHRPVANFKGILTNLYENLYVAALPFLISGASREYFYTKIEGQFKMVISISLINATLCLPS